jgi:hypothetical protein
LSRKPDDHELSREEVWAPRGVGPTEWVRSNAYLDYRVLKGAGPWALIWLACMALAFIVGHAGYGDVSIAIGLGAQAIWVVMLLAAFFNARRSRREAIERQRDGEQVHHRR